MKKPYETPCVERIAFQYRDQVVAASNGNTMNTCYAVFLNEKDNLSNPPCTPNGYANDLTSLN